MATKIGWREISVLALFFAIMLIANKVLEAVGITEIGRTIFFIFIAYYIFKAMTEKTKVYL